MQITIISSLPGESIRILTPAHADPRNVPTILLGHLAEQHYYSLEANTAAQVDHADQSTVVQPSSQPEVPEPQPPQSRSNKRAKTTKTQTERNKRLKIMAQQQDNHISDLLDEVSSLSRADVISRMEVPVGHNNNDFQSDGPLETGHTLLGIDDESKYWVQWREKQHGDIIQTRNGHFYVSDHQMSLFLNFRDQHRQFETELKIRYVYIDIVLVFWLFTTGRMRYFKNMDKRDGSFLQLSDADANAFFNFKDDLCKEWRDANGDD